MKGRYPSSISPRKPCRIRTVQWRVFPWNLAIPLKDMMQPGPASWFTCMAQRTISCDETHMYNCVRDRWTHSATRHNCHHFRILLDRSSCEYMHEWLIRNHIYHSPNLHVALILNLLSLLAFFFFKELCCYIRAFVSCTCSTRSCYILFCITRHYYSIYFPTSWLWYLPCGASLIHQTPLDPICKVEPNKPHWMFASNYGIHMIMTKDKLIVDFTLYLQKYRFCGVTIKPLAGTYIQSVNPLLLRNGRCWISCYQFWGTECAKYPVTNSVLAGS